MAQPPEPTPHADLHLVRRYAGARLYDTTTLSYVTLDPLRALARTGADGAVHDSGHGSEITRSLLVLH